MWKAWKEWAGFPGSVTAEKCADTSVFGWFLPAGICSRYSRNYARNVQLSCLPQPCRAHIITAYLAAGRGNGEYRGLITAAEGLDNRRKGVVSHELLRFRRACSRFFHRFIRISSAPLRPPTSSASFAPQPPPYGFRDVSIGCIIYARSTRAIGNSRCQILDGHRYGFTGWLRLRLVVLSQGLFHNFNSELQGVSHTMLAFRQV